MKTNSTHAEAAQYALLCRISPSLRHSLVGRLHPIGLTAGIVERQLRTDKLNLQGARESIAKVQLQAREAIVSAIGTLVWLTGEESAAVALKAGVDRCIGLIRTDCEMRGVSILSNIGEPDSWVSQRALRIVLTATLIAAVDMLPHLSRIELSAAVSERTIDLQFDLHCADPARTPLGEPDQRPLRWNDMEALAEHEGVVIIRTVKPPGVKCRFNASASGITGEPVKSALVHNP